MQNVSSLTACARTLERMLIKRHYNVDQMTIVQEGSEEDRMTLQTEAFDLNRFTMLLSSETCVIFQGPQDDIGIVCVWQADPPNHYVSGILSRLTAERECVSDLPIAWPLKHFMVLTPNALRLTDIKDIHAMRKYRVETFIQSELEFDRTTHHMVPAHRLMAPEEGYELLRALNVMPAQCPRILQSDIICRYFGGKVGDVFEIHRKDKNGEDELFFRIVVP